MTLEQISQQISDVQKIVATNPEEALVKNRALFIAFAEQDGAFVVNNGPFPLSAPAQDDDPRLFLRVFSHEEVAQAFVEKRGGGQITAIDGVELMQLAKAAFLRGVYGFLLNDGLAWAILSFPDFLQECFRVVLGAEDMYDRDYVALIQLINMVRRNDFYKVKATRSPGGKDLYFLDAAAQESEEFADWVMDDLQIDGLLQVVKEPTNNLHIQVGKSSCAVSADMLQAALRLTCVGTEPPNDFHVNSISLAFRPEDFAAEEPEDPGEKALPKRKRKKEHKSKEKRTRPSKKPLPKPSFTAIIFIGVSVFFLVMAAHFTTGLFTDLSSLEQLRKDISEQSYSEMADHYAACEEEGTSGEALEIMLKDLDTKFQAYVDGSLAAEDLKSIIAIYASIEDTAEEAHDAYARAATVEQSKIAYKEGLETESVSGRLELWRKVSMDDTDNYRAMLANLSEHALEYKYIIFTEAAALPESDALSRLILLQSFYPGDVDISAKIRAIQTGALVSAPAPEQPAEVTAPTQYISITRAAVHGGGWDEEMDLFIDWKNTSGREIEEIDFEVIPYDSAGNQVSTKTVNEDGQSYSRYLARDVGPFAADFSTSSSHRWEDAWVNSSISSVTIDKVSILFVGEETPTVITDTTKIAALLS